MRDKAATFSLFYPELMDAQDFANYEASGCHRVQAFLGIVQSTHGREQLRHLGSLGAHVTFRVVEGQHSEDGYYAPTAPWVLRSLVNEAMQLVYVEGVIVGNEPEHGYDLTWSSQNWGNLPDAEFPTEGGKVAAHADAVRRGATALEGLPVKVISPGWTHRRITPYDPPQPGKATWREITATAYNKLDANGVHLYAHGWQSVEDENRLLWVAGEELARCHREVYINEIAVNSGQQVTRMRAVILMYDLLSRRVWSSRVKSFCPFVSNGTGQGYDPGYIMRDPLCYSMLGRYIHGN